MRILEKGKTYCGRPLLRKIEREPAIDGCGCPVNDKAKSPGEHCPLATNHLPAQVIDGKCNCKWCSLPAARQRSNMLS